MGLIDVDAIDENVNPDYGIKLCVCGLPLSGELNKVPVRLLKEMADEMENNMELAFNKDYIEELIHQIRNLK